MSLDYEIVHPECRAALEATRAYLSEIEAGLKPRWLALLGASGVGKTHLAKHVAEYVRSQRLQRQPVFFTGARILNLCENGEWGVFRQLAEQPHLVLDDMTEPFDASPSAFEKKVFRKFDSLLNQRLGKWTLITDNRTRGDLARMEPRMASRLKREGNIVVEFRDCPDYFARR